MKYLWAREHYKAGVNNNWVPEEISMKLGRLDDDMALTYSYHHARWHDLQDNLWLQFAFDQWTRCMVVIFED